MTTNKILIADSGATKTDWCLVHQGKIIKQFQTKGFSPVFQTKEEITEGIQKQVYQQLKDNLPDAIFFYGTGCIPEKIESVKQAIQSSFPINEIEVYSDLVAAAHSLCGNEPGIACILGTGSNSCEWNGQEVTNQIPSLGYILGDEGSGAYMGKMLVGEVLKNQLTKGLKEKFLDQYNLTPALIIENVYRKSFPSRFLASLTPFLLQNIEDETIANIVNSAFGNFFERNVMQYDYKNHAVNLVGSIAHYYSPYIHKVAQQKGITIGTIYQSPMEGLIKYYS